ncbi:MAG: DUF695 domain-containing protein [Empedobacter falsenii]
MNFFKNIFNKKEEVINSYEIFWKWFQENEYKFFETVKNQRNIEKDFFDKLSPQLDKIKSEIYFLTGMADDNTVELIFTPDGIIKNIVFVEELVAAAPKLSNWKFIALKPATGNMGLHMENYTFAEENLSFYPIVYENYPDEIDIVIAFDQYKEEDNGQIVNGIYIFLDNYLGELNTVTIIDNLTVIAKDDAAQELIPMEKLKDYLIWREKEFVEQYQATRYETENDSYSMLEAQLESGNMLLAVINTNLLNWDSKPSHPWMAKLILNYDGSETNGMPNFNDYELMNAIEDELMEFLVNEDGYLNVGRETAEGEREIYFACKDFRKPSKIFYETQQKYKDVFGISFTVYKDKYWHQFERFRQ